MDIYNTDAYKQKQVDLINATNPCNDNYHTWVRSVDDIQSFSELIATAENDGYKELSPDFTVSDAKVAILAGRIKVYSSYPIKEGVFVTPSRLEAQSYSADGKVYEKIANINDIAWIDELQGQYAPIREMVKEPAEQYKGFKIFEKESKYAVGGKDDLCFEDCTLESLESGVEELELYLWNKEQGNEIQIHSYDNEKEEFLVSVSFGSLDKAKEFIDHIETEKQYIDRREQIKSAIGKKPTVIERD